ncbi:Erythroid differentiation-related factor 1 [Durusdinium trenchii]|uniref:Erythroid differentiation-related factor 1 n=1 Tax=Durusdinium trenchii TaxID=1381693 RepID=A0ABP0MY42_9DINO
MESSFFTQPPIAYFQPLQSSRAPFISCEPAPYEDFGSRYESISSKVCGWAGELGKDHDLRQAAHCAWLSQTNPFEVSGELPSSTLIPTAQRQPRVDFVSSATAMKSIFRASFETESDVGVAVHRLGDWLVIDDGSELSWCPHRSGPDEDLWAERVRDAEQLHRACQAKVEAAKAKSRERQQYLEKVRSMLWDAEVAASQADEELREALAEASRAAEACEHLKAPAPETYDDFPDPDPGQVFEEEPLDSPPLGSQDDPQLYRNFLGHSIQQLQDELIQPIAAENEEQEVAPSPTKCQGELVLLDGPPASFHQVGVWKMADDASVVVGSRLLCLGNSEHPKLTLYLHGDRMISDTILLEHWLECLMAGVPEFAVCFHRDGAVQSYSIYKLSELQRFLEERMELGRRVQMTLEVLRWIKRQCRLEGCSYWLSKDKKDASLKLIKLSGNDYPQDEGGGSALPVFGPNANGLVLKNTFLELPDEDEPSSFRRALSCPARFLGNVIEDDLCHVSPFCSRISTLFFCRAVSSTPGPDAARFFRQVLDLETYIPQVEDEEGAPARLPSSTAGRAALQACSHLGLALCELEAYHTYHDCSDEPGSFCAATVAEPAALLSRLRHDLSLSMRPRYRMLPWTRAVSNVSTVSALFVALPPWPSELRSCAPTDVAPATVALKRAGDALDLLKSASKEETKRLEALALPISALVLLQLASLLLKGQD